MLAEMRQRRERPTLQFGIVATRGIGVEQRDHILVRLDLDLVVACMSLLFLAFSSSSIFWCWVSSAAGSVALTLPPSTRAFNSLEVF
jgi:hypothetical protein